MTEKIPTDEASAFDPSAAAGPDSGIFGMDCTPENAQVVLLPVPYEATVSYGRGTAQGPRAILAASHQVDLFDLQTVKPYLAGIVMLPESEEIRDLNRTICALTQPVLDEGGASPERPHLVEKAAEANRLGSRLNDRVSAEVGRYLRMGRLTGVVGGEHSVSFGAIRAVAETCPGLGVLHIDAHADLRTAYEGLEWSHASVMANVMDRIPEVSRSVQVGVRDLCEEEYERIVGSEGRIVTYFDPKLQSHKLEGRPWKQMVDAIVSALPERVYVSFDIDGLEPSLCPHTGTPVPGGLTFPEAMMLLEAVVESGRKIMGFDLTEVAPGPDGVDWDANVGARVLYKLIGFALLSRAR